MHPLVHSRDPRTVARRIVGILETVFPRLLPVIVGYVNRTARFSFDEYVEVDEELVQQSTLQKAMLFEIAVAVGEALLNSSEDAINWGQCFDLAVARQRQYYDAQIPRELTELDRVIALRVAENLAAMLNSTAEGREGDVVVGPHIPGFGWIANGNGDYAVGRTIIEVKCRGGRFSTADYRQLVMYWLLSFLKAVESDTEPWEIGLLLNPRMNLAVEILFSEFVPLISGGRTPIEAAESFRALVMREQK